MAVKVADLFNDTRPEIYLAQIAGRSSGVSERLKMQPLALYCDAIQDVQGPGHLPAEHGDQGVV